MLPAQTADSKPYPVQQAPATNPPHSYRLDGLQKQGERIYRAHRAGSMGHPVSLALARVLQVRVI